MSSKKMPTQCIGHEFGKETTLPQLRTRVVWERWAAELARSEGNQAMACAHDLTAAAYLDEIDRKARAECTCAAYLGLPQAQPCTIHG